VEDDSTTARVTERILRQHGYWVTTARSAAEALSTKLDECHVVVCDIGLPDGTGFDLMRRIRARRNLPGIALTGFGTDGDIEKSRAAGFATHLTKPIDFARLDAEIQRVATSA
jgi:CheY-like chemotaxis protein